MCPNDTKMPVETNNSFIQLKNALDKLFSSSSESILFKNQLDIPHMHIVQASKRLLTPEINSGNVKVDFPNNRIIFNIPDQEPSEEFARILGLNGNHTINISDMSTFPQKFAFSLFEDFNTAGNLNSVFGATNNSDNDDLALDFHMKNEDLELMMKFSTSRDPTVGTMRRIARQKTVEYEKIIKERIGKLKSTTIINKRFCFTTMVCSKSSIIVGSILNLPEDVINEICARYRFSLDVLTEIGLQGVNIEDIHIAEMKGSVMKVIKSIPEMYQDESATSRVKMTKERIITGDISAAEADEFISERYRQCLKASVVDLVQDDETNYADEIKRVFYERNTRNTRTHMKHVLQLPNCLPPVRTNWKWEKSTEVDGQSAFINGIIKKNFYSELCETENLNEIMRKAHLDKDNPVDASRNRKKVYFSPSYAYRCELAKNGIQRQSGLNAELKKEVWEKKIAFSLDVDVSDIDKFLFSEIPAQKIEPCASVKKVSDLVLQALSMCDSRGSNTEQIIDPIMGNLMFNWCSFIAAIASELCICLRDKVGKDEWIVRRLREWDAYLIVKPERFSIFYSVVMPTNVTEVIPQKVARKPDMYSNYSVVEFISTIDTKLANLAKAEAFFISMISQWSRHYGLTFMQGLEDPDVWAMTRLLMLVQLEDKSRTEEIMSLFRYISMEKFSICRTNSRKMLGKFPPEYRSRLQVWVTKKLMNVMCMPNYVPVDDGTSSCQDRQWKNMINPYTGKVISTPAQLVELYYVGYATNKHAQTQPIAEIDLIKKVLEYEVKLHEEYPEWCGITERQELDSFKFHEWSRRANCAAADHLKKYLQRLYGEKMDERLTEKILHRLCQLTWDQVASLKASSQFDPSVGRIPSASGHFTTQRVKVIIAILKKKALLAETPALSIASVLSWINSDGGLRVDIFKKSQHGGLREIYILEVRSRILQLVLEEIARAICENVPNEMMTHPDSKTTMPQNHIYEAATRNTKYKQNISSSNDARVWNQSHHVTKFAQFLVRVLPKEFHNLIVGGLKQFLFKRIALPDGVLNYAKRQVARRQSDNIKGMFWDAYAGKITVPWLGYSKTFLLIESGMMQGILHYTSSLFHASILMLRNSLWTRMTSFYAIDNITTDIVSSDDSARLTDVFSDDSATFKRAVTLAKLDHIAIKHFSRLYGIWLSPKSTMCTSNVMEFNSEFYFNGNIFRATIKWALAALKIFEEESLVERQESMNNQITALLEGGSGFRQASETQLAQLFLHYKLLGMGTNPLFTEYADLLISNPDPALGFFLLDPPIAAGFGGFNFILWKAISSHPELNKNYAHQLRLRDISTTTSGILTSAVQIRSAIRQRVCNLIAEVENVCPMWHENIEANPSVLYTLSRDLESSLLKIMVKLTSPSVIKSWAKGTFQFVIIAAAEYLINGIVTTIGSNWISTRVEQSNTKKVSLWKLVNVKRAEDIESLTQVELNILFSRRSQYEKLEEMLEKLKNYELSKCGSKKMLKCNVKVFKDNPHLLFDLETVVRWRWFGEKLLAPKSVADKLWIAYRKVFPWLEDDPFATLKNPNCHFGNQIQLSNFILERSTEARSVHLLGAPVRGVSAGDLVMATIKNNQLSGYTLEKPADMINDDFDVEGLQSALASILTFPLARNVKEKMLSDRLMAHRNVWDGSGVKLPDRKLKLALVQNVLRLKQSTEDSQSLEHVESERIKNLAMRNALKSSGLAVYGEFVQIGEDDGWNGHGEWVGMVGNTLCRLEIRNFTLISVTTDDFLKLHDNESLLVTLLEEFRVTAGQSMNSDRVFDLKTCEFTHHGAVHENTNLVENSPLDLDRLILRVDADTIRLLCQDEKTGISYTVVAYTIEPTDFKFSGALENGIDVLNCWMSNCSLKSSLAEDYLIEMMRDESTDVDREEFKEFVRDSLASAIARAGVKLKNHIQNGDMLCDGYLNDFAVESRADDDNLKVLEVLDRVDFTGANEDYLPELRRQKQVNYYDFCDYLEGNIEVKRTEMSLDAVKKNHRLWDDYVDENLSTLSKCEKAMLERQCFVPKISKFIQVLEYYLNLRFDFQDIIDGVNELVLVSDEI